MKDLVKAIRLRMDMNQEQFALAMGVTPVTVSRWENGKAGDMIYYHASIKGIDDSS